MNSLSLGLGQVRQLGPAGCFKGGLANLLISRTILAVTHVALWLSLIFSCDNFLTQL